MSTATLPGPEFRIPLPPPHSPPSVKIPPWFRTRRKGALPWRHKRVFDVLVGIPLFIIALPIMILIGFAILLTSGRPVLYWQSRQGLGRKPFRIVKFRTMRDVYGYDISPTSTRVTWVGRILRPHHLDELPQLWNVIIGQMSMVGPRPLANGDVSDAERILPLLFSNRYTGKPGITGLAQIRVSRNEIKNGKGRITQFHLDMLYIQHQSLWNDLQILMRTIPVVLRGQSW